MTPEERIGKRYGKLVVLAKDHSDGKHTWYKCQCDCGNIFVTRGDYLGSGRAVSCGCTSRERCSELGKASALDLTGKRFGMLTAIERVGRKGSYAIWRCKCDCGGTKDVTTGSLTSGDCISCGCLLKQNRITFEAEYGSKNIQFGTSIGKIRSAVNGVLIKSNRSGIRGVYWHASGHCWRAFIGFQSKQYQLCQSQDINVCAAARKEAEQHIFVDFLDWYDKEYPDRGKKPKHASRKKKKPDGDKK